MSPKISRLLLLASMAAGFGILPMSGARADSAVVVHDLPTGFQQTAGASGVCKKSSDAFAPGLHTDINKGDSVNWYFDGSSTDKHNITPANDVPGGAKWPAGVDSGEKAPGAADPVVVTFKDAGVYYYYSSANNDGSDNKGQLTGMCGVVHVTDPNATTTTSAPDTTTTTLPAPTPTTAPPATTGTTAPASASPSASHVPPPAAPAPTTTATTKPEKDHKGNDTSTTTTTAPPVNGPTDLPAEAIVPNVTPGATTQDGAVLPSSTPTGDATALIKQKHGHKGMLVLVATGIGIGALGAGTAAYKFANRSSKYFPA